MTDNHTGHRVKFETLGCKLNFSETATLGKLLGERGIAVAAAGETPDICVVNTCSVTELADRKCRQHIRRLIKLYPDALMVVTGCYAQLKSQEIAEIPGVDIVLGSEQKLDIAQYVEQWFNDHQSAIAVTRTPDIRRFSPSCERGDRTRYWLKVQDGCDYYCSYCTIPMARGRSRSGTIQSLVDQAQQVADEGGKEIVITGVNIGDFGKNTGEKLLDLFEAFDRIGGIERYRISSIEPDLLTDDQLMPDCFIGVDVMVGTRGETDALFDDSYKFIAGLDLQHLHVFPYSERPGTMALRIPVIVPQRVKQERAAQMIALSDKKQRAFIERYLGTIRPVLMEQPHGDGPMHGFTDNYIRVNVTPDDTLTNRIVPVRLVSLNDDLTVEATILNS